LAYVQLQHKLAYIFHKAAILLKLETIQTVYMERRKQQEQNMKLTILRTNALLSQDTKQSKQKTVAMPQQGNNSEKYLMT
jgi:hypothetical protein